MADITKYAPINGGTVMSDLKAQFSIFRTNRKSSTLAYAFVFVFIAFTIFLAFTPSTNSSTPWLTSTFSFTNNTTTSSSNSMNSIFSEESYRSHFSPIVNYFFPNSSSSSSQQSLNSSDNNNAVPQNSSLPHPESNKDANATNKVEVLDQNYDSTMPQKPLVVNPSVKNNTIPSQPLSEFSKGSKNQTQNSDLIGQVASFTANQTVIGVANTTLDTSKTDLKNVTADGDKVIAENGATAKTVTLPIVKKQSNGTKTTNASKQGNKGIDDLVKSLIGCDLFDGNWVSDDSYPLYKPGSCSLIDEQFNCFRNGRPDNGYQKLKWKPKGCTLPRLDGIHMLELLRGKRLVFVGDSLNRNMWESLICILKNSVKDKKKVYEASGRQHFRTEAAYAFVFEEYKCTVEFFVSPFLVQEWEVADKNGTKKETLRLDLISSHADKYKSADIIVFNTGHWWTHEKTSKGEDYYQEGSHVYKELNVLEAFRKAITTWGRWVDAHVNPMKSLVFFRGYSASHFSGGQWNSGGQCDNETEPIKDDKYLTQYPPKMSVLENVLQGMKTNITYLNVTRLTDYRKDGHPSIYRKQHYSDEEKRTPLIFQDCSHWCLPGVPDAWNELLFAELLVKLNQKQQQKRP